MKNYRLKEEHPDHFLMHDTKDGKDFKIAKAHLDLPMMAKLAKVQKFEEGGEVKKYDDGGKVNPSTPESHPEDYPDQESLSNSSNAQTAQDYSTGQNYTPSLADRASLGIANFLDSIGLGNSPAPNMSQASQEAPIGYNDQQMASQSQGQMNPVSYQQNPQMQFPNYAGINADYAKQMSGAFGQEQAANTAIGNAQAEGGQAQAEASSQLAKSMNDAVGLYQQNLKGLDAEQQARYNDLINAKIDPNHYWNSKSTGQKIGMLAGMIVSGFGANAGQGNMAMDIINKNIDNDMESQRANLGKTETLLSANLARYGSLRSAFDATKLALLTNTQAQIDAAAAKTGSVVAQQNAKLSNAQIAQKAAILKNQLAMQQAGYQMLNGLGSGPQMAGGQNPNMVQGGFNTNKYTALKLLTQMGQFDPKEMAAIDGEYSNYSKLQNDAKMVQNAMNTIQQQKTLSHAYGDIPGTSSHQMIKDAKTSVSAMISRAGTNRYNPEVDKKVQDLMEPTVPELVSGSEDPFQRKTSMLIDMVKHNYEFNKLGYYGLYNPDTDPNLMPAGQKAAMQRQAVLNASKRAPVQTNAVNPNLAGQ